MICNLEGSGGKYCRTYLVRECAEAGQDSSFCKAAIDVLESSGKQAVGLGEVIIKAKELSAVREFTKKVLHFGRRLSSGQLFAEAVGLKGLGRELRRTADNANLFAARNDLNARMKEALNRHLYKEAEGAANMHMKSLHEFLHSPAGKTALIEAVMRETREGPTKN